MTITWTAFDDFRKPPRRWSWEDADSLVAALDGWKSEFRLAVAGRRRLWDELLADLGGDPGSRDWTGFRPLRQYREEDWSDWLAQLLEDSESGLFAAALFRHESGTPVSYARPAVQREVIHEGYRADLVVEWPDRSYTHIEVKVGDPNLAKTLETAYKMQASFASLTRRSDVLLLLPEQREAFEAECRRLPEMRTRVVPLDWLDVARALRTVLPNRDAESINWRVWAHSFCGAIEQGLLRFGSALPSVTGPSFRLVDWEVAERLLALPGEQ